MDIKIATYFSEDCPVASDAWTARLYVNGVRDMIGIYAASREAVIAKAETQAELYRDKFAGMVVVEAKASNSIEGAAETQVRDYVASGAGRGAHFAGTKWVVNFDLKDKKRVAGHEVDGYLAKGYVLGGPRTQV